MSDRAVNEPLVILAINPGVQPKIFQGKGGFVELGHLDKYFNKNEKEKSHAEKYLGCFSTGYFLNYILNGKFDLQMDKIMAFFPKSRQVFQFSKKGRKGLPPSLSYAPEI